MARTNEILLYGYGFRVHFLGAFLQLFLLSHSVAKISNVFEPSTDRAPDTATVKPFLMNMLKDNQVNLLFLCCLVGLWAVVAKESNDRRILVGVSGLFEEHLEHRERLDFRGERYKEDDKAEFVGKGLVRGFKGYFNVQKSVPTVTPLATGCENDAHIFSFYLVAPPQVTRILINGPDDLTISPRGAMIDLEAPETSERLKNLASQEFRRRGLAKERYFSAPLVTGIWLQTDSYVEMPDIMVRDDGTQVTSFLGSIALWSGIRAEDLVVEGLQQMKQRNEAWDKVSEMVRQIKRENDFASSPNYCGLLQLNSPKATEAEKNCRNEQYCTW